MNVKYSENAKKWPTGFLLLQEATERLDEIVRVSSVSEAMAEPITAEWNREAGDRYTLTLSDPNGQVSAPFTVDELATPRQLRSHLFELWGDLLQVRSEKNLKKIRQMVEQLTADGD